MTLHANSQQYICVFQQLIAPIKRIILYMCIYLNIYMYIYLCFPWVQLLAPVKHTRLYNYICDIDF